MECLIIYNYFFPAYKAGGPIQSLNNLIQYLKSIHSIKVICSNKDLDGTVLPVNSNTWLVKDGYSVFYSTKGAVKALTSTVLREQSAVVFINGMFSPSYNFLPALLYQGRKIVSVRGMLHPGGLKKKPLKKKLFLAVWKLCGLHHRCEYHATDERERNYIKKNLGPQTKVWVAQNLPRVLSYFPPPIKAIGELRLCTVALISPMKNHLLILKILTTNKSLIRYDIYGPIKDKSYWMQCQKVIEQMPQNIRVRYHGDVHPDQVAEIIAKCHVYIQPSEAENFGHSLYEAMSLGRPVITSLFTPWQNLQEVQAGVNVSLEDEKMLAMAIDYFASMNNQTFKEWSGNSRRFALSSIDVAKIKEQYMQMFLNKKQYE